MLGNVAQMELYCLWGLHTGESGYAQEPCQYLNPLTGGSWGEWVEKSMEKSYDTPVMGWDLFWAGKHRLRFTSDQKEREEPLENHSGNGFPSTSRKAISRAEKQIFNEQKIVRKKIKLYMFSACTEC